MVELGAVQLVPNDEIAAAGYQSTGIGQGHSPGVLGLL